MTNNKNRECKLCGANSGRRRYCLQHKIDFPFVASSRGQMPFDRSVLMSGNVKKSKGAKMFSPEEIFKEVSNGA